MTDLEKNSTNEPVGLVVKDQDLKDRVDVPSPEDLDDVTWGEVCSGCFCHTPAGWLKVFVTLFFVVFFLYFFIVGLELLGEGAQVMTGCTAGAVFGSDINPVSGLMVGILVTCLLQSSSTTTSIVVTLVGAGTIAVEQGIYMIMGANIGTSVTNTIVAMGQLGDGDELERAFAGATVHDMFNFLTVAIFFPLEVISGMFFRMTEAIVRNLNDTSGSDRDGFVGRYIEPVAKLILDVNRDPITAVAEGGSCAEFFPSTCEDPSNPSEDTCEFALIECGDKHCPVLFQPGASRVAEQTAGLAGFLMGLTILFICLYGLVKTLHASLESASKRIIYKATDLNGYLSIFIGCGITLLVQSSSITTSTLVPFVGMDLIRLEQMYPLTLGANLGTTLTGLLAALVDGSKDSLQVAFAHLFFNVFGIIIWYPIPFMRNVPLHAARQLGKATRVWKGFPLLYVAIMFFLIPLTLLGISALFTTKQTGLEVLASILVVFIFVAICGAVYYWRFRNGRDKVGAYFEARNKRLQTLETLPYDMTYYQRKVKELQDATSCAPATGVSAAKVEDKKIYEDVVIEMKFVSTNIDVLIDHVELEHEADPEKLGRFLHKEKEPMPTANIDGLRKYRITLAAVILVCLGLMTWAITHLFLVGSHGAAALGGYLLIMTVCVLGYFAVRFFFLDGRNRGMAAYRDTVIKREFKAHYTQDMAQLTADVKLLMEHTNLDDANTKHGSDDEEESA